MRHHSQSANKMKQTNPRSNAWCRYRCWWWRWCTQGPTRRHFGCLKSIYESLRNKLFSSSDPFFGHIFWHAIWHAIWHSHFISYIFCYFFRHSIWYIFGDSFGWGPAGNTLIINFDDSCLMIFVVVVAGVVAVAAAVVTVAVVCCLLFLFLFFLLLLPLLPVQIFSQSCSGRTSSNRWCFHGFFWTSRSKKTP